MLLNINRELTSSFFSPFRFESSCSGSQDVFSSWGGVTKYDDFTFRFTITSHFNFRLAGIPRIPPLVPLEAAVMNSWSRSTRARRLHRLAPSPAGIGLRIVGLWESTYRRPGIGIAQARVRASGLFISQNSVLSSNESTTTTTTTARRLRRGSTINLLEVGSGSRARTRVVLKPRGGTLQH